MNRTNRLSSKGIFFLYRLLQAVLFPLLLLYFLQRVIRSRAYAPTLWERLGFLPREYCQTHAGAIWFHAVSVGEALAIAPLIAQFRNRYPCAEIFVSTGTLAGYAAACEKLSVKVFYAPVDYVFAVRQVLRALRPSLLVIVETEIWPNLLRETARTGCSIAFVNARISDRMAARYARWRRFFHPVLACANTILAQSELQRERFLAAGAPVEKVAVAGNIKYDFSPQDSSAWLRPFAGSCKLWIAASTTASGRIAEEDAVLRAFRKMPGWKLVIAPRQPARFSEVADILELSGIPYSRRSLSQLHGDVLLLDTIGELSGIFPLADAVFMGGSLVALGGHNILEPAFFGKPIVVGPHMENFREIAEDFRAHHAFVEIGDPGELASATLSAAGDAEIGKRAQACCEARRGAVNCVMESLSGLYENAVPRYRRALPALLLLWPLAQLWRAFRRRPRAGAASLGAPVVSIGNITVGGTGKTPLVLHLAAHLAARGRRTAILTRGHGRNSPYRHLVLEPGSENSAEQTGDEAQIFLRAGVSYLGIGADRVATGRLIEQKHAPAVFLLDDGFQQFRLARSLDIVTIDAMQPFGDGNLLPLGRLREPLDGLARASVFVITRTECHRPTRGIEAVLRGHNPDALILRARVKPLEWVEQDTGKTFPPDQLPYRKTLAFCGLGNAQSFWRALDEVGISPCERLEFEDHHRYTPREVQRMGLLVKALGLQALLTTQKDVINLCESTEATVAPAKVLWLRIGLEFDDEPALLRLFFDKVLSD